MMRYLYRAALSVTFAIFLFSGIASAQMLDADLDYVTDVVILKFSSQFQPEITIDNGIALTGITEVDELNRRFMVVDMHPLFPKAMENGSPEMAGYFRTTFIEAINLESILAAYNLLFSVEIAEPVAIHRMDFFPNDPYRTSQWALARIDAYQGWDITRGDPSFPVAILDTGVDWNHPDLDGDVWLNTADPIGGGDDDGNGYTDDYRGWDFVTGVSGCWSGEDCSGEDNDPMDFAGHGTHVSGIAAAETNNGVGICGIAFDCSIMCLRIGWLANDGWAYVRMDFAAEAMYYAANEGARGANCSWGSSYTSYLANSISYASSHNVVVVSAAGNDGNSSAPYLGTRSDVIAVAATDQTDHKASWSNYGTWVDIAAPGVSIWSTYFNNTYAYLDGTSMSAPHVAGLAALIAAADPSLTRLQRFNLILDSAEPINDTYYNQGLLGSGRVNVFNAVMDLGGIDPPDPASPPNNSFTSDNTPTFTWTDVDGATAYHIQISQNSTFSPVYLENSSLTGNTYTSPINLPDGIWYWRVRANDGSEWSDWSTVWNVGVDTQAPGAPINLAVDPDGWTNNPEFTFTWIEPADLSGIATNLFKIDSPPENDYDFDGIFNESPGIYATAVSGEHALYLWCIDNLDNVDYQNNASVMFYYDGAPPSGCAASSPPYSSSETFDVSWSTGSDGESGLSGLYDVKYKEDDGPWTDWMTAFGGLASSFTGQMDHIYYFEARTSDQVGNFEQFTGIAESSTQITQGGSLCGYYVIGDYNNNGVFNVSDVIASFSYLQTGAPLPFFTCECPEGSGNIWGVTMDVNNNCQFNVSDVINAFSNLQTGSPLLIPCELCPPDPPPVPPGSDIPLRINTLGQKSESD